MPIPKQRLVEASQPLRERLLDVLRADSENAYTIYELRARIERLEPAMVLMEFAFTNSPPWVKEYRQALDALVSAGAVVVGRVNGSNYYGAASAPKRAK